MNARALIGQLAMVYCASKLMEISRVSAELLYKSNRPPVFMEMINNSIYEP